MFLFHKSEGGGGTERSYTVCSRYQGKRKTVVIYLTSQLPYSSRFEVLVKTTGSHPLWTGLFEIAGVWGRVGIEVELVATFPPTN